MTNAIITQAIWSVVDEKVPFMWGRATVTEFHSERVDPGCERRAKSGENLARGERVRVRSGQVMDWSDERGEREPDQMHGQMSKKGVSTMTTGFVHHEKYPWHDTALNPEVVSREGGGRPVRRPRSRARPRAGRGDPSNPTRPRDEHLMPGCGPRSSEVIGGLYN